MVKEKPGRGERRCGEGSDEAGAGEDPASGWARREGPSARGRGDGAREAALEAEADRLLAAAGAFRRSTGILGQRRLVEIAAREESLEALAEATALELGSNDVWDEMDALATWCGLTALQKAALAMWRLGEYTQEEIARELGCSRRSVQRLIGRAMRRVRRGAREFPGTARALFWEEVRWKARLIYRKPGHRWRSGAGGEEMPG